ncbi:MAG: SusE domain-containing protein [Phocaeicola sp.]|nr:SusE domain-containing protein [Phocaeicola sp.]
MKKIIKSTLLLLCSVCLFTACSDDNDSNPVLLNPSTFPLNTPSYAALNVDLATTSVLPFTWSQPNYGFPAATEYQLQVSKDGQFTADLADFDEEHYTDANFATLSAYYTEAKGNMSSNDLSSAINKMFGWGEDNVPDVAKVYVRATATTTGAQKIYSNVVSINVIPNLVIAPSFAEFIWLMGNHNSWSDPLALRSPNLDGIYQRYNWLDGGFKFRPNEGDWNGDWGQDPTGAFGTLIEEGEEDCNDPGKSFPDDAQPAGFYQIDVDMTAMTWKITPVKSISIIGTVNGNWDNDTDMTFNTSTQAWEATVTLNEGEMKFRMNHDWAVSWGVHENDLTNFDDLTQYDGKNLTVEAGTYKIQFFLNYEGNNYVKFGPAE